MVRTAQDDLGLQVATRRMFFACFISDQREPLGVVEVLEEKAASYVVLLLDHGIKIYGNNLRRQTVSADRWGSRGATGRFFAPKYQCIGQHATEEAARATLAAAMAVSLTPPDMSVLEATLAVREAAFRAASNERNAALNARNIALNTHRHAVTEARLAVLAGISDGALPRQGKPLDAASGAPATGGMASK